MKKMISTLLVISITSVFHPRINPWKQISEKINSNVTNDVERKSSYKIFSLDMQNILKELKALLKKL